jgi:hypothetical protein
MYSSSLGSPSSSNHCSQITFGGLVSSFINHYRKFCITVWIISGRIGKQ